MEGSGLRTRNVIIAFSVVFFLLGLFCGYLWGWADALDFGVRQLDKYANITINPDVLKNLIIKYGK